METVFEGVTEGLKISVRYPQLSDLEEMHRYINEISQEKTYITYQGEEVTLSEEEDYLKNQMENIEDKKGINLLVFYNNSLIATSHLQMGTKTSRHVGQFGISVAKAYRGKGIGKLLMKLVTDEGIKNLSDLVLITLGVFANNKLAYKMYKDFGFTEYGRLPGGVKLAGGYVDHIYMYKKVR